MFVLNDYLQNLIEKCRTIFGARLLYIGLQGSYLREEAKETSDIDIMIVIDDFSFTDMDTYRTILKDIGYYEKSCGFICGKDELAHWSPLEVCQILHTTKDLYGSLTDYLPSATKDDEINYVKMSLGNLYHEICHRYIHADRDTNISKFRGTCKGLFFLVQNLYYLESGSFVLTKRELKEQVSKEDREILKLAELQDEFDFENAQLQLFTWCQSVFTRMEKI